MKILLALFLATFASAAAAQTPSFTPRDETPEEYPAGDGRDETFYACTACHNFRLVAAQGQTRRQWNDTIDVMISKHTMPKPDDKERETILNYLEATYPPRTQPRGFQNPFLNR